MNIAEDLPLGPFSGGVDLITPSYLLSKDRLGLCSNWELNPDGLLTKRAGSSKFGSAPAKVNGDNLVNFLARYYYGGSSKLTLVAAGGKLRYLNDSTGAATDISIDGSGANMEATLLCDYFVYKDRIYILDGTKPIRYDGTNCKYAGHYIHVSSGWTIAGATGGALTLLGAYNYIMTSVAGTMGEGPPSASKTLTLTGSNNQINLSTLDLAGAAYGATARKLYRTIAGGSIYYLVATLDVAATSYNDTTADSALGAEYVPSHAPRSDSRFAILGQDERTYWFGRSGINASVVEPSDPGFPDRILDSDFFAVSNNDGDVLTGAGNCPTGLVFFKNRSMWLSRAFGFGLDKIGKGIGCSSRFSILETPYGLIFLSQDGIVFLYDGDKLPEPIGYQVSSEFKGMTASGMSRVFSYYENNRYHICYDKLGSRGYNHLEMTYDFLGRKWDGPHENGDSRTPSYVAVFDSYRDNGEILWGEGKASKGSYIYQKNSVLATDDGAPQVATAEMGPGVFPGRRTTKVFRVAIRGSFSPDASITVSHIGEDGVVTPAQVSFASGAIPSSAFYLDVSHLDSGVLWDLTGTGDGEEVFDATASGMSAKIRISDNGTASKAILEEIMLKAQTLEFK